MCSVQRKTWELDGLVAGWRLLCGGCRTTRHRACVMAFTTLEEDEEGRRADLGASRVAWRNMVTDGVKRCFGLRDSLTGSYRWNRRNRTSPLQAASTCPCVRVNRTVASNTYYLLSHCSFYIVVALLMGVPIPEYNSCISNAPKYTNVRV